MYYDYEYGYVDKNDLRKINEVRKKQRMESYKEKAKLKRERNRSYLKGRRGVRRYYDYDKLDELGFNIYNGKEKDRPIKCVFTKNLRREKLFAYLKYLKGKKIAVRDLAWKFAVTDRTIQSDLKYFIENGFIQRQINKTRKGKMTKNSYIVNKDKAKDLEIDDQFLFIVFIAKKDNKYYVLTKTKYDENNKTSRSRTIEKYKFNLPKKTINNSTRIDKVSLGISKHIFNKDLKDKYKSMVYCHITNCKYPNINTYGKTINEWWKEKYYFSLFILDNMYECSKGYNWVTLNVAPRRIGEYIQNKGLKYIKDDMLG